MSERLFFSLPHLWKPRQSGKSRQTTIVTIQFIILGLFSFYLILVEAFEPQGIISLHGSGTTIPSKCYRDIMGKFEAQAKHPLRLTYRAVGSSLGQVEFINNFDPNASAADFGSADIPISSNDYQRLHDAGIEIIQAPVLLAAISFFHSIEGIGNLNLTACLLARIFTRDITVWNHPDIVAENPEFTRPEIVLAAAYDSSFRNITVARRVEGTGSAFVATSYMHHACPEHFPINLVGTLPAFSNDTVACSGSRGMVSCLQRTKSMIGFLEAGYGHAADLAEVRVENADGTRQTSAESLALGGIAAAGEGLTWPSSPLDDFGAVSLLNRPGNYTWPLVLSTFVYVRKDLTFMKNLATQSLFVAFLQALYDPYYVNVCVDQYGAVFPGESVRRLGQQALDILSQQVNQTGAPTWVFEKDFMPMTGMGDYVLSSKRQEISQLEIMDLTRELAEGQAEQESWQAALEAAQSYITTLQVQVTQLQQQEASRSSSSSTKSQDSSAWTSSDEHRLDTALILAGLALALSAVMWLVGAAALYHHYYCDKSTARPSGKQAASSPESAGVSLSSNRGQGGDRSRLGV